LKRLLSLLLCVVLLFGMIPTVNAQADTETVTVDTAQNEVTVSGTNSVGNLLSEEIQQAQEESQLEASEYTGGYAVIGLSFEGNMATVEYSSLEEANLIVALYTEDGMQLLTSGNAVVSADETVAEVTIEGTMPQYFMASAYLVDIYDFSPLCPAYDTPMYTQEMQALLASTAEDYDPDKVLNLDDSSDTNFAVYTDSVVVIDGGNGVNEVVGADYENDTYVIVNADGQITSLTAGTIIAYPYAEGEVLIVKISTISINGSTVTITGAEMEIEEVFAYMKLETDGGMENAEVDESTCDEGVTYEGVVEETAPPTRAWEGGAEVKKSLSYRIEKEFQNENASVTVSGGVRLNIGATISFYISQSRQFVEFKITPEVGFDFSISGKLTVKEILLSRIIIFPTVPGMIIDYKSSIILETDASIVFKASLSMVLGFGYDSKAGFQNLCSKPTANADMSVEGKIFFGINNIVNVAFLDDNIASFGLSSKGGIQITGELTRNNYEGKSAEKELEIHHCSKCLDLSFDYVQTLSAETVFFKFIKAEKEILSVSFHLFKYYISFDPVIGGSGFGSCPFRSFRITLKVLDEKGKPVVGASVQSDTGEEWGVTNSNGLLIKYLLPGTCLITASSGDQFGQKLFAVSEPGNVTVRFGVMVSLDGSVSGGILGTVESEKFQDEGIYQSGNCGDNLTWVLTNGGTLYITGTGDMKNYSSSGAPWHSVRSKIQKVIIGDGLKNVGEYAFSDCSNLISINIPEGVVSIGKGAFNTCSSLGSVSIPASVLNIADGVFYGCTAIAGIWVNSSNRYYSSDNYGVLFDKDKTRLMKAPPVKLSGSYVIPNSVVIIDSSAFNSCQRLTKITIPNSVTTIGGSAFAGCYKLRNVIISGNITNLGVSTFDGCYDLQYSIFDDAKYLGNEVNPYVVLMDAGTSTQEIHTNTKIVAYDAFRSYTNKSKLTRIVIPDSVISIGDYAFDGCTNLTNITIGDSVTDIGRYAFYECSKLSQVVGGNSVTSVGECAFRGCSNLTSVNFSDSLLTIGDDAFRDCDSMTIFTFGNNIVSIGSYAFYECDMLTSVIIPDSVTSIGDCAFQGCSRLSSVTIGNGVTRISMMTFEYCSSLKTVNIPEGVTRIGAEAFKDCSSLTSIIIPASVTSLGMDAFHCCKSLAQITFKGNAPKFISRVFWDVTAKIYYPANNSTWTSSVKSDIGSNCSLTWVKYTPTKGISAPETREAAVKDPVMVACADVTATEPVEAKRPVRGVFDGEYNTEETESYILKTASFRDLVPGQEYLLLAMCSMEVEKPLAASNLLYVDQAPALEDGTLVFQYVQREDTPISYVMACGASNKDLRDAVITFPSMCSDIEVQAVNPTVVYNGETLQEGLDYAIVGAVDFTEPGIYTCYIRGIYKYTGIVPCTYTVLDKAMVTSWNLTLGEMIAMNFYMAIGDEIKDTAVVDITLAGETISLSAADGVLDDTTGQYVFTVKLAPAQMTETVTVSLRSGEGIIGQKSYSVRQYAEYILDNDNGYEDSIKNLVKEMLNYGAAAQTYFSYNTGELANEGISVPDASVPAEVPAITVEGSLPGISLYGISLVFRSKTAVRFYFNVTGNISDFTFSHGSAVEKEGRYYVEIANINPQDLANDITLSVNEGALSVTYSPLNYIVRMYNNKKGSNELKALVQAMYGYYLAARKYAKLPVVYEMGVLSEHIYGVVIDSSTNSIRGIYATGNIGTGAVLNPNWNCQFTPIFAGNIKLIRDGISYDVGNPNAETLVMFDDGIFYLHLNPWVLTESVLPLQNDDILVLEGQFSCLQDALSVINITRTYILIGDGCVTFSNTEPALANSSINSIIASV